MDDVAKNKRKKRIPPFVWLWAAVLLAVIAFVARKVGAEPPTRAREENEPGEPVLVGLGGAGRLGSTSSGLPLTLRQLGLPLHAGGRIHGGPAR